MLNITEEYLQKINHQKQTQNRIRQIITALSLIVVLSVSWGLKLTGITLAGEAFCGFEEHAHNESCAESVLICGLDEAEPHMHTESCIARKLLCTLVEEEAHTHTEACYGPVPICGEAACGGHHHEELCYEEVPDCGLEETEGHFHNEECQVQTLTCGQDEADAHTHEETCYEEEVICGQDADDHIHDASCIETVLTCGTEETPGHIHLEDCYSLEIGCGLEEAEPHVHDESCMILAPTCGMEECPLHLHDSSCYGTEITCGIEESQDHAHEDSCMTEVLLCEEIPCTGHFHEESCYEEQCICGLNETPGHTHTDECFELGIGFGCGLAEADGHIHTEDCLTEETEFGCGLEISQGHTHGDDCYETQESCGKTEHIHVESCYSDLTADLETSDDWEMSLAGMTRGGTTAENVIKVATSQLGCMESERNFEVDATGTRRGITRYGQWYGNPYGDWSSMFVSFCLFYGGAEDLPANAGPESMRLEWEQAGLFESAQEYGPQPGNLVFLSKVSSEQETVVTAEPEETTAPEEPAETTAPEETTEPPETAADQELVEEVAEEAEFHQIRPANAVAIITDVSENSIRVIEGDLENTVAETTYNLDDPVIVGYGIVPEVSTFAALIQPRATNNAIAQTVSYSSANLGDNNCFVLYVQSGKQYYAFDGSGKVVLITIDANGNIFTDIDNPDSLLWTFSHYRDNAYYIQNVETGLYMHAYNNNGTTGVTTSSAYTSTLVTSGSGVKIRSNTSDYIRLNTANGGSFARTQRERDGSVFLFGMASDGRCTVWLDGTDGGLRALTGAPNTPYTVQEGSVMRLPTEWTSPSKYSYRLRGWYDVTNNKYYPPGAEMVVTGNAVLYADWVASTFDIGEFNAKVADTVSTNAFITTHMFDYNYLLNLHSVRANNPTISASGHSENWTMVTSGNVAHGDQETLNFIFVENDASNGFLCMPNNRSDINVYPGAGIVTPGIYSHTLGDVLFSTDNCYDPATGSGVLGKTYLGTGDHLFQIMDDPSDEHYGYYYYDSKLNAASYHQSNGRFYVYEYLEATSDAIGSTNSDFLPLNSPYANTNGKTIGTYNYNGLNGEYNGVPHYRYDSKYNSGDHNSTNNVHTDYAYGMRTDINFYLPKDPGSGGNKDLYGNDIQFQFSGDDDLWVLVDGQLVLDIGGIHGAEEGVINFSTGQVTVQGKTQTSLMDLGIEAGDHTLSILYLERGSSLSNCSIYFNLVPRFGLEIRKEDVLTQQLLPGTQFTVYEDFECTQPAELWASEEAYKQDLADGEANGTATFTVGANGVARLWGFGSGNTYYIKETAPPNAEGYGLSSGIIRLTVEKKGQSTYHVDVIADAEGNAPSNGFTVHGVQIDEETQTVYIVVTNAPETVTDTTTVQVIKKWEDKKDHSEDYITAYLKVTDPDGTVRRIREVTLSDENNWNYIWTNLPKYDYEALTEVQYGIEESYESGYYSTVRRITQIDLSKTEWAEALTFQDGETYILRTANGYLSTLDNKADTGFKWVDEETAKTSPNALWTTKVTKDNKVKFTNGRDQTITLYYGPTDFYARIDAPGSNDRQEFSYSNRAGGLQIFYQQNNNKYYLANSMNNNKKFNYNTNANQSLILNPMVETTQADIQEVKDWAYQITNTPLAANNETSMAVSKSWNLPAGYSSTLYQEFNVTVRLLANGVNTGRTVTLNLKNNWRSSFLGLPYKDENGNVITYTVEEIWDKEGWSTQYGEVIASGSSPPTYSVEIVNTYYPGGPQLPSTGSAARRNYILCGYAIMVGSLVYGFGSRRKRERRMK